MKITFLGTAAAEAFPGVFCNCKYCKEARKLKGKNFRTRSQALINDDLLIDLPPDTYSHFLNNNIEGDTIKYLLVTHSHSDHLYPQELTFRYGAYAHDMRVDRLKVYCGPGAAEKMRAVKKFEEFTVDLAVIKPFDTVNLGDYTVTALKARHFIEDGALFYIIKGEKTILYAHDTGFFFEEIFDFIKDNGYVFDLVSYDCTYCDLPISDEGGHMGIDNINRVVKRLREIGAVTDKTKNVINHFSHNAAPIQHELEERVAQYGYIVSYDGLTVEI